MLKKIIIGALLTGMIGALTVGAINRTSSTTARAAGTGGQGNGRNSSALVADVEGSQGQNRRGQGQGQGGQGQGQGQGGQGQGQGQSGQGRGQGGQGQGQGQGGQGQSSVGRAEVDEWVTLQGTVASVDAGALTVELGTGELLVVDGRAWRFAQEQGFSVQAGDEVRVVGFDEDGEFKEGQLENITTQTSVLVREEGGRPLWAGGGQRGS